MAVIEKFLGQRVVVPEDRRYDLKQGLWGRSVDKHIVFGLTQPALVLSGGMKDIDTIVDDDQTVGKGESILFAITGKILYIEAPVAGGVEFNKVICDDPAKIVDDPYDQGWLFLIEPVAGIDKAYRTLSSYSAYLEKLRLTEGFKNPEGIKGGVSGICKAVYTGIGEQKMR